MQERDEQQETHRGWGLGRTGIHRGDEVELQEEESQHQQHQQQKEKGCQGTVAVQW